MCGVRDSDYGPTGSTIPYNNSRRIRQRAIYILRICLWKPTDVCIGRISRWWNDPRSFAVKARYILSHWPRRFILTSKQLHLTRSGRRRVISCVISCKKATARAQSPRFICELFVGLCQNRSHLQNSSWVSRPAASCPGVIHTTKARLTLLYMTLVTGAQLL